MKKLALMGSALMMVMLAQYGVAADKGVADSQMGLSKTAVEDVPDPQVFEYRKADPTTSGVLPRAYLGAPPQVPHDITDMVPIKRDENQCQACHDQPATIGKKVKGEPTAMPASHYVDVKAGTMHMGRFNCTQCHTPQATVKPLVNNTFKKVGVK